MRTIIIITTIFAGNLFGFQPVDINSASLEQIALLPGVGNKLANNIVLFRKKHGPFLRAENLVNVDGMTNKKLLDIKDKIIFIRSSNNSLKSSQQSPPQLDLLHLPQKPVLALDELEIKVLKAHGLNHEIDESLQRRARKAAFLPTLAAIFDLDHGHMTAEKLTEQRRDSLLTKGARDFGIGIKASFDLDRLIFNKDELEVQKLSLKRLEKREEVIAKLHKNYFRYLRLAETAQKPLDVALAKTISLEMHEIEALLDSMSLGAFTKLRSENIHP